MGPFFALRTEAPMLVNAAELTAIHRYCSHHRELLERSTQAGCVRCGATFSPAEITEWIVDGDGAPGGERGETAKCPKCGFGAVLPSAAPVALTPAMLSAIQRYWFSGLR